MKPKFDTVVLATNDNPKYSDFVPYTVAAWRKFFPEVKIVLAYITSEDKSVIAERVKSLNDEGVSVLVYPYVGIDIPSGNYAKVCRLNTACECMDDRVCFIADIDTVPLSRDYYVNISQHYEDGKVLAVGGEDYEGTLYPDGSTDEGKFPMHGTITSPATLRSIVNPDSIQFLQLLEIWKNTKAFDDKEDILNSDDPVKNPNNHFSDESLFRVLVAAHNKHDIIKRVRRDIDEPFIKKEKWIDRSWSWSPPNTIDINKMKEGGYVECNMLRPLNDNRRQLESVLNFIMEK